jgi:hypothetical protein
VSQEFEFECLDVQVDYEEQPYACDCHPFFFVRKIID